MGRWKCGVKQGMRGEREERKNGEERKGTGEKEEREKDEVEKERGEREERKIHVSLIACWSLWAEWSHGRRLTLPLLTQTQSDACSSYNFARNCITPDQVADK